MRDDGILTLSETDWAEAKRRADVIGPLSRMPSVGRALADEAAQKLGLSRRHIYELIRRYSSGPGLVTDVAPKRSNGGKGKSRLQAEIDGIITKTIESHYLSKQRYTEAALLRNISERCRRDGLKPPARNTIRKRIEQLDPLLVANKRYGTDEARKLQSIEGAAPMPRLPLEVVQIDHTKVDLVLVDEKAREPIGRPFLTLAIDVYTRCIVGMLLTLEAPSATSVGLCLSHIVTDKTLGLERLGLLDVHWPMSGKPGTIFSDNASEFKSEALTRGCQQHGIKMQYRPLGQPQFGGIIERVIGTAMEMIHQLPGTTFSNSKQRGSYDSEANAILTLRELEKWLVLAICTYHETVHSSLHEPPIKVWRRSAEQQSLKTVADPHAFLVDFLPVIRRKIQRVGFVIDHIIYYADHLKHWIAERHRLGKFIIRRDPRDLSRVWVLDPRSNHYLELQYRTISNPAVTLWEHQKAIRQLKAKGQAEVDEGAIFRMVNQMREITRTAAQDRKRARRDNARTRPVSKKSIVPPVPPSAQPTTKIIVKTFAIEEW